MSLKKRKYLETPELFDFPFPPYDIQQQFMKNLYNCLETGKFGIFESPTGTGKSLSIICGAIRWLKDHKQFEKDALLNEISQLEKDKQQNIETSDWLSSQAKDIEIIKRLNVLKMKESRINDYERKIENMSNIKNHSTKHKLVIQNKVDNKNFNDSDIEDDTILIQDPEIEDDYLSDDEDSSETYEPTKIYICSRTHSQLAQFIGEIIKSPFCDNIRVVSLASRQVYCINPKVRNLRNMALINESTSKYSSARKLSNYI